MKKLSCVRCFMALLLATSLLVTSCGSQSTASTMSLIRTEGMVDVFDDEGKGIPQEENLRLYSGYNVDTGSASYAWINLDNVKLTKMDQNSEIAIEKEGKNLTIEVKSGSLFFHVTEPLAEDESMSIRISNMAVGIRGTCGWTEVPDGEHMNLYLLEGKVECSAGEKTIVVKAGEKAYMSANGDIEIEPFSAEEIPAFVAQEIKDDEDLINAILEDSAIDVLGNPLIAYADILEEIKGEILYTEMLDFEADGSPELLVLYLQEEEEGNKTYGIHSDIWRDGPEGASRIGGWGFNVYNGDRAEISLVESGSRLFLRHCSTDINELNGISYVSGFDTYFGSLAQRDGDRWSRVEGLRYEQQSNGTECAITDYDEDGYADSFKWGHTADEYEAVRGKYREVKVLVRCPDGENLIVTPDPAETGEADGVELIAPYVGTYTDERQGNAHYQLTVKEDGSISIQDIFGYPAPDWLQGSGTVPESVQQRVDGTILVTIHEKESYLICPLGKMPSLSRDSDYRNAFGDMDRVRIVYLIPGEGDMLWNTLFHN